MPATETSEVRRRRNQIENQRMRLMSGTASGGLRSPNETPEQTDASIAAIYENQRVRDAYLTAPKAVQKDQTPQEVGGSINRLDEQAVPLMRGRIMATERAQLDALDQPTFDANRAESVRLREALGNRMDRSTMVDENVAAAEDRDTGPIADRIRAQQMLASRQGGEKAFAQGVVEQDLKQQTRLRNEAERQRVAKVQATGRETALIGTPDVDTQLGQIEVDRAKIKLAQEKAAVQGGRITPERATAIGQEREGALSAAGLGSPESQAQFLTDAQKLTQRISEHTNSDAVFGALGERDFANDISAFNTQIRPRLEQIASGSAEAAADIARGLLAQLPENLPSTFVGEGIVSGLAGPLAGGAVRARNMQRRIARERIRASLKQFIDSVGSQVSG